MKKVWQTDGQTDRRTDKQTDWPIHKAARWHKKINLVCHNSICVDQRFHNYNDLIWGEKSEVPWRQQLIFILTSVNLNEVPSKMNDTIYKNNISYYNWKRYPLSSLKPRFLALIEQHLPNISDPVYSPNHLCDSCGLIDVNPHFIPSLLPMIQNVGLLCHHRYKSWPPAIVTSQWPIVPAWFLWMLS